MAAWSVFPQTCVPFCETKLGNLSSTAKDLEFFFVLREYSDKQKFHNAASSEKGEFSHFPL